MRVRPAQIDDLGFILDLEWRPEMAPHITQWEEARHRALMDSPDTLHLVAEEDGGTRIGYAVLHGLTSPNSSIELARIGLTRPGEGLGQGFLEEIKSVSFNDQGANRLWLDVFPGNKRARRAYAKAGFIEEGTLREAYFHSGRYRSLVIMSVLRREYLGS
jgi:diamine N-acetyltransferase